MKYVAGIFFAFLIVGGSFSLNAMPVDLKTHETNCVNSCPIPPEVKDCEKICIDEISNCLGKGKLTSEEKQVCKDLQRACGEGCFKEIGIDDAGKACVLSCLDADHPAFH